MNRSTIISFFELSEEQKEDVISCVGEEWAETDSYVMYDCEDGERAIHLSQFMRISNPKRWDGVYTISNNSSFVIRFNKSCDECLIAIV